MDLESLRYVQATKIIKEVNTEGSAPLMVLGDDNKTYIAKTTRKEVPRVELINELIVGYFSKCWSLKVPNFVLITVEKQIVENYLNEGNTFSKRYQEPYFESQILFGSELLSPIIEIEDFIKGLDKRDFSLFESPVDLLKIGSLDLWIGNKDRKPNNPNILLGSSDGLFNFHPIDHAASFAYIDNYLAVRDILLRLEPNNCILSTQLAKSIVKFAPPDLIKDLKNDILVGIRNTIDHCDFIFEQVPTSWGFSKKGKTYLKEFISDKERNKTNSVAYLSYIA